MLVLQDRVTGRYWNILPKPRDARNYEGHLPGVWLTHYRHARAFDSDTEALIYASSRCFDPTRVQAIEVPEPIVQPMVVMPSKALRTQPPSELFLNAMRPRRA